MKSILFSGYYGQSNTGDDAFCVVAAWGAKKYWNMDRVDFLSSAIPKLTVPSNPLLPAKQCFKGQFLLMNILFSIKTQHIIYFGGSLFHTKPKSLARRFYYGRLNLSNYNKVSAVGVSLGPFKNKDDEAYVRSVLNRMNFLTFRDEASYQIALKMNLTVPFFKSFDPAVLLPFVYCEDSFSKNKQNKDKPILGISLCYHNRHTIEDISIAKKRERTILSAIKSLINTDEVILRFFIFNDNPLFGDGALTNEIINELNGYPFIELVPYSNDPGQTLKAIKECDAFLGVRLHSAIFSYIAGIPFVLVEYHRKCGDFLDDIGYNKMFRIHSDGGTNKEMSRILRDCLSLKGNTTSLYKMPLKEAQKLALINFRDAPWCIS